MEPVRVHSTGGALALRPNSATPCYPNRRAFSRSRSSRISLSSASESSSALSIGRTSSPLRRMGFTRRGFRFARLSRMSVTLPSGSLSASKLACGGNKSRQAILPLLSAVNVMVELSHRCRTISSPFGREPPQRSAAVSCPPHLPIPCALVSLRPWFSLCDFRSPVSAFSLSAFQLFASCPSVGIQFGHREKLVGGLFDGVFRSQPVERRALRLLRSG